jgi:ketosteroid isomerase-like protein
MTFPDTNTDTDTPAEIRQLLHAYVESVLAKDVEAFVALYDADLRVFDMWNSWSYDSRQPWREMVQGWFGSLRDERVAVAFSEVQTRVTQDLAVLHAFVSFAAIDAGGATLRSMTNRITMALVRRGDDWKIVHQHTSAPIDGETKAIFQR